MLQIEACRTIHSVSECPSAYFAVLQFTEYHFPADTAKSAKWAAVLMRL